MKRIVLAAALCSALFSAVSPVTAEEMSEEEKTYWAWIKEQAMCNADKAYEIYSKNGNKEGCKGYHIDVIDLIKGVYGGSLSLGEFKMLW
ncbi:hypothetical protein ACMY46_00030 [Bartonella bacilliformis]|uniref:hypothetical protein n=1 Tax=Bartonella bacilliformis TaxID=774 RepID=UPI00049FB46A|nr:hypothetical protein [Bartonella bacilliformis]KEG17106.1 hypothetical protein H705_01000 [Bartonella bacilliformis Cond044]KEG22386.1 hypothetical protein H708_00941 [Bartonella bacilliformis VAB9028]